MIAYRVDLFCDRCFAVWGETGTGTKRKRGGIMHDDHLALPNLGKNARRIAAQEGWHIGDGGMVLCPECKGR